MVIGLVDGDKWNIFSDLKIFGSLKVQTDFVNRSTYYVHWVGVI